MVKTNYSFARKKYVKKSAVKRAITKRPRKVRIANPNKTILSNALSIKKLENAVNGHIQKNYQVASFNTNPANTLSPTQPYCFNFNDFTDKSTDNLTGGTIFKPTYTGAFGSIIPVSVPVGNFEMRLPSANNGLATQYQQWRDQNNDRASLKAYQPLYAEYTFSFTRGTQEALQQTMWVRIDTLKRRRLYQNTNENNFQMPDALGAFQNMANKNNPKVQNAYNPALWSVKTRWLKLPQMDITRTNAVHTIKMKMGFPKKLLRLNLGSLDSTGTNIEPFHVACDPRDAIWCILSISDPSTGTVTSPIIPIITRKIVYRDQRGVSM